MPLLSGSINLSINWIYSSACDSRHSVLSANQVLRVSLAAGDCITRRSPESNSQHTSLAFHVTLAVRFDERERLSRRAERLIVFADVTQGFNHLRDAVLRTASVTF